MVCQIDTGAQANIISIESLKSILPNYFLKKTNVRIFTFSGEKLSVLGTINLEISYEGQTHILNFFCCDFKM